MSERYIVIPNWQEFQHYKGKDRPSWIKLYPRLLRNDDFLDLSPSERMILLGIWMLYAESGRRIAVDTAKLTRSLNQRVTKRTLDRLNQAGFIEFRSRDALEELYAREEKRREETPISPQVGNEKANSRALGTNPRALAKRDLTELHESLLALARSASSSWPAESTDRLHERLDELERDHGGKFSDQERQVLIDEVLASGVNPKTQEVPF